jgi:16S rRNA (uracil1498-N3)-methyltransferase
MTEQRRIVLPHLSLPSPSDQANPLLSAPLSLDAASARYLLRVLRQRAGDVVEICDGAGRRWLAEILAQEIHSPCSLRLLRPLPPTPQPFPVFLAQALAKGDRFEQILRQGTELGLSGFYPLQTQRTIVRIEQEKSPKRQERWEKIVAEAARQARRSHVPFVSSPLSLAELPMVLPPQMPACVCWEGEQQRSIRDWLETLPSLPKGLVAIIGPEGGFEEKEIQLLVQAGIASVSLGSLILRTETAGIAVASIFQYLYGLLSQSPHPNA